MREMRNWILRNWKKIAVTAGIAVAAAAGVAALAVFVVAPAVKYGRAGSLEKQGDAAGAYEVFDRLGTYRDAAGRKQGLQAAAMGSRSAESMPFGGYDWLVLEERDGMALLLMESIQEKRLYHEPGTETLWAGCTLRAWLNGPFYGSFNVTDRARIAHTAVINSGNAEYGIRIGAVTSDYIFLLSLEEAKLYFPDDAARVACSQDGRAAWWWLRSPGMVPDLAAVVTGSGTLGYAGNGVDYYDRGVRPAMWVKL